MVPARRRAAMAAGCAVVAFLSAAGFASLYASAGHSRPVLVVTSTVGQGQPLTSADLSETDAAVGPGVAAVPVADASWLKGKSAAVTIPAGSLLTPGDLTIGPSIPSGQAVVGLALKAGQLPAGGAVAGQPVMLVETGSPGTPLATSVTGTGPGSGGGNAAGSGSVEPTSAAVLAGRATVFGVATPTQDSAASGSTVVSVLVPTRLAPVVATAAAADQVSLVVLAANGAGGTGAAS